ncbi:MAG: hypothetical protein WEC99_02145 [Halofilum sp. (in: g-proteobacteria)]
MMTKAIALVLEISALVVMLGAFAATPIRWDFVAGGIALAAVGLAVRKRFGMQS